MIVLDTNVVSEVFRAHPEESVATWVSSQPPTALFITAITQAELLYGVELLPAGRRRQDLSEAVRAVVRDEFAGRVLPFDGPASQEYAKITAARRARGRPISAFDAQIAAIARSRDASVATRDVDDFDGCGVEVINPWRPNT